MSSILWFLLLLVGFIVLAAFRGKVGGMGAGGFPYRAAKALFTPAERSFLGVLDQAVGPQHRVFGKVRLADVAVVEPGLSRSARQAAFNRISAKHFDFVVCRASDLAPVCAIELNDSSHASRKAQHSDALKANVCQAIGLPLLSVPARRAYPVQELRERFQAVVSPASSNEPTPEAPDNALFSTALSFVLHSGTEVFPVRMDHSGNGNAAYRISRGGAGSDTPDAGEEVDEPTMIQKVLYGEYAVRCASRDGRVHGLYRDGYRVVREVRRSEMRDIVREP